MKPQAPRTYALFQEYFYEAHCELTKTTTSAGYHSSNAVKDAAYEKLASEFAAYKIEVNKKNTKSLPSTPPKPKLATDKKDHVLLLDSQLYVEHQAHECYLQVARRWTCGQSDRRQPVGRLCHHLAAED
jgi:hypothetical protein